MAADLAGQRGKSKQTITCQIGRHIQITPNLQRIYSERLKASIFRAVAARLKSIPCALFSRSSHLCRYHLIPVKSSIVYSHQNRQFQGERPDATDQRFCSTKAKFQLHWPTLSPTCPNPPSALPAGWAADWPEMMQAIFPDNIIRQEMSAQRWIEIPAEVRQALTMWRPAPLFRAHRLEAALGTPAKIFYKYEGVSPAVVQSWTRRWRRRITTAGRHPPSDHRNRRRPVGLVAGAGGADVRHRYPHLHGECQLPAKSRSAAR